MANHGSLAGGTGIHRSRCPGEEAHEVKPAFYAASRGGRHKDWWTILHPPYTAWHLSYVVIGAALAPRPTLFPLFIALGAFFLAVGVAAHCLDELHGRPLKTAISKRALVGASTISLLGAGALGIIGVETVGWVLIPLIVAGVFIVVAYNAEVLNGLFHNDVVFSLAWGAFPVLAAYIAETGTLRAAPLIAAGGAFGLSTAQRELSKRARFLRRSGSRVEGTIVSSGGLSQAITGEELLRPLERALWALSCSVVAIALALALARMA
jgi:asparagine N-glycosylation enzyme membrane subunit Stt3